MRSPLIALCGTGTAGCLEGSTPILKARWVWDGDHDAWWDGSLACGRSNHTTPAVRLRQVEIGRTGWTAVHKERGFDMTDHKDCRNAKTAMSTAQMPVQGRGRATRPYHCEGVRKAEEEPTSPVRKRRRQSF